MKKASGILMPIFALPGKYGIGTFGKESYDFVDFLEKSGQKVWQILPLSQTVFGDSPYQTTADCSYNPYFCDLEELFEMGLITKTELKTAQEKVSKVDYGKLYNKRLALLKKAFERFDFSDDFLKFVNQKKFYDYAVFMTAKKVFGEYIYFPLWLKKRDKRLIARLIDENSETFLFYNFTQYILEKQYFKLKKYANDKGIIIMGDLPLYVAYDSADVWKNPEVFYLDEKYKPIKVAGVPPDYFSEEGQLWGNPIYDYDQMQKDGFKWWKTRIKRSLEKYDLLRIDHFRGLDRFWAIPLGESAKEGQWIKAYGEQILSSFSKKRLIAEDLGIIDEGVIELLKKTNLPGMKVLLFAFDGDPDNAYLPKNVIAKSVAYVGTHDNDTAYGYAKNCTPKEFATFKKRVNEVIPKGVEKVIRKKDVPMVLVETLLSTKANLTIISFADLLSLSNEYRINTPSTIGNWKIRFKKEFFSEQIAYDLYKITKKYNRI